MFGMPGGIEWIIILIVALLIFGRRLPEVMKSMGKGIVEFKKGIKGIENEVEKESTYDRNNLKDPYVKKDNSDFDKDDL